MLGEKAESLSFDGDRASQIWPRIVAWRSPACVWNTGSSSPGELEMTRSTSEVAVCCSSASVASRVRACTSSNSRTFSIAITAWSAKVVDQLDLLFREGTDPFAPQNDHADGRAFTHERDTQSRSEAGNFLRLAECVLPIGKNIRNMNCVALQ